MAKTYGKSPIDDFHFHKELKDDDDTLTLKTHKPNSQVSLTGKLSKIVFEDGTKDDETDYIDLHTSLHDMIKFTEKITRRKTPLGSQVSLKTEISNPDCHCGCHEAEEDLQFLNEKTQTDQELLLAQESLGSHKEVSMKSSQNSHESAPSVSAKTSDGQTSIKSSAQLLKQIYTEIKVCRCFEKYAKNKKSQKVQEVESVITKEDIQQKGVLDNDEKVSSPRSASKHSSKEKAEEDCPKTCDYHCPPECSTDKPNEKVPNENYKTENNEKEKKKKTNKSSKDDFVDVDLSNLGGSQKDNASPSQKNEKSKQRDSFIKRLSDPFTRRGSKSKNSK